MKETERQTERDTQREKKSTVKETERQRQRKRLKKSVKDVFVSRPLAHYKANVREEMEKCTSKGSYVQIGTDTELVPEMYTWSSFHFFFIFYFFYSSFACSSSSEPHRKIIKIDKKTGRKEGGDKIRKRGKMKC